MSEQEPTPKHHKWRERLSEQEYKVAREGGTEPAFSGRYWDTKTAGTYHCVCCGLALFNSSTKYDSGTGWPSFYEPLNKESVCTKVDSSLGMKRVEALCSNCDAHLGHVFPDGPKPTGERYCMNSASLRLEPSDAKGQASN